MHEITILQEVARSQHARNNNIARSQHARNNNIARSQHEITQ